MMTMRMKLVMKVYLGGSFPGPPEQHGLNIHQNTLIQLNSAALNSNPVKKPSVQKQRNNRRPAGVLQPLGGATEEGYS